MESLIGNLISLFLSLLLVIATCSTVPSDYPGKGCDVNNITVMANFDLNKYSGKWYEVGWLPVYFEDPKWAYIDYVEIYSKDINNINRTSYGRIDSSYTECNQGGKVIYYDNPSKYQYSARNGNVTVIVDYWIIDTDYSHYSLCYGCTHKTGSICEAAHSWIWSRDEDLEQEYYDKIYAKLPELCLNQTDLIVTKQEKECHDGSSRASSTSQVTLCLTIIITMLVTSALIKHINN